MLARRELSEQQVRQRLARKAYDQQEIDDAIERLRRERALDDARVAEAMARTEMTLRKRGKIRVQMQIERAGISKTTARRAVASAFEEVDDMALLEASLAKRLRGRDTIDDQRELERLYRYLVSQGFEPDQVMQTLKRRKRRT